MTPQEIVDLILGNLGTLVTLLIILYGGYKRWWVFGWYAKELQEENRNLERKLEELLKYAKTSTHVADRAVALQEKRAEASSG